MPDRKRPRGPMTAAEFMAQLEHDDEYQSKVAAAEAERRTRVEELRLAEVPIVQALQTAGVEVGSVWDLVNTSTPYPEALPVLLDHLVKGGYPDRVMESLGRALAVKPASQYWETLRELYLSAQGPGEVEGLAVALAEAATKADIDGLIALLGENDRGESRTHFLRAILRLGGRRGEQVVSELSSDDVFGREATALLKRRKRT